MTRHLTIIGLFSLLAVMLTWPLLPNFTRAIPGDGGDASLFVWDLWWFKYASVNLHQNPFWCNLIFHPVGVSLYLHTFSPFYGLMSIPIQAISNPAVSYNLLFLLTFVLTGWFMYMLARSHGLQPVPAFISAFAFTFSPVRMIRALGHLNLLSTQFLPLFLLVCPSVYSTRKIRWGVAAGLILAVTFYTCYQHTVLLVLVAILWYLFTLRNVIPGIHDSEGAGETFRSTASTVPLDFPDSPSHSLSKNHLSLLNPAVMVTVFLLLISPMLWSIRQEYRWEGDYLREDIRTETFLSDLSYYLNSFPASWSARIWESATGFETIRDTEKVSSPGVGTLLFAIIGIMGARKLRIRKGLIPSLLLTIAVFLVLSLGSELIIGGWDSGVPLPYVWLRDIPLLGAIRVPGRFALVVSLGLSLFAGWGAQFMMNRRKIAVRAMMLIPGGLMLLDSIALPFPIQQVPLYREVKQQLQTGLVANRTDEVESSGRSSPLLKTMEIPFGIQSGFRPVGVDVSRHNILKQTYFPTYMMSGHVSRCPNETLSYFFDNPFLRRLNEIQSEQKLTSPEISPELMRSIVHEWLRIGDFDQIIVQKKAIGTFKFSRVQLDEIFTLIETSIPEATITRSPMKVVFSLKKDSTFKQEYDFRNHPENDVYIYNPILLDSGSKFVPHESISSINTLRVLLPMKKDSGIRSISLRTRGTIRRESLDRTIGVFLNRQHLGDLPYENEWSDRTLSLPASVIKDGTNVLQLEFSERNSPRVKHGQPDEMPVSIAAISASFNCEGSVDARILVNGRDYCNNLRGMNVVVIDPFSGRVVTNGTYDTCGLVTDSNALAAKIERLKPGMIVAAAVKDDASVSFNERLAKALRSIGGQVSLRKQFRLAYAVIGVKGWPSGKAFEKTGEKLAIIVAGNDEIQLESLKLNCENRSP